MTRLTEHLRRVPARARALLGGPAPRRPIIAAASATILVLGLSAAYAMSRDVGTPGDRAPVLADTLGGTTSAAPKGTSPTGVGTGANASPSASTSPDPSGHTPTEGTSSAAAQDPGASTPSASTPSASTPGAPTSSAPTSAAPGAGTAAAPSNGPTFVQIFSDDFTTPAALGAVRTSPYASRWATYEDVSDTSGNGWYDPDGVVSVTDGLMDWYVHTADGRHRVAAMLPKTGTHLTYGRWEFRFRSDELPGYKIAFLLWPDSNNWADGEIDFPEVDELVAGKHLYAALHPIGSHGVAGSPTVVPTSVDAAGSGWHTARIDWVPGSVTYYLDGAKVVTLTRGVPTTPFHLVFQVESQLSSTPPPDSTAGHVQVDWVRVYRYEP